jgi:hypothetical protein
MEESISTDVEKDAESIYEKSIHSVNEKRKGRTKVNSEFCALNNHGPLDSLFIL